MQKIKKILMREVFPAIALKTGFTVMLFIFVIVLLRKNMWTIPHVGTFNRQNVVEQQRLRRACADTHGRLSLCCSYYYSYIMKKMQAQTKYQTPRLYNFLCTTQLSANFQLLIKSKMLKNKDLILLSNSQMFYLLC